MATSSAADRATEPYVWPDTAPALPPPLVGTDGGFTAASIQDRIPKIVTSVVSANAAVASRPEVARQLEALAQEAAKGDVPLTLLPHDHPWNVYMGAAVAEARTWMSAPWWLVENYLYKRLLMATGFYSHACTCSTTESCARTGVGEDPFQPHKQQSLVAVPGTAVEAAVRSARTTGTPYESLLRELLLKSLWGNKADLSLSGGDVVAVEAGGDLLADDVAAAVSALAPYHDVTVVVDNHGPEILADLVLVDALLHPPHEGATTAVRTVTVHVKSEPTFVSDVTLADMDTALEYMRGGGPAGAEAWDRLRASQAAGRLVVVAHDFYVSPLPWWHMPADLRAHFSTQAAVVVKGDANYRRLLGDRHWPHDTPFADVVHYFPCAVVALRTCKAGLVVGVSADVEARVVVATGDGSWLVAGKYGVVQVAE